MPNITFAVHGGAGTILQQDLTAELESAYRAGLQRALDAGYAVLLSGGTAIDAVRAGTCILEDDPLFNAGRGSVFTNTGKHEMDAAIMDGLSLSAGAVAGIQQVRNPVEVATAVMRNSEHVLLSGAGALEFARKNGMALEEDSYFFSQFRYNQWLSLRDTEQVALDHNLQAIENSTEKKFGTVGAVACDRKGNVAAATSTGGMTNKKYGRIGDTPLIGCGTYANNHTCAISATGHGELFIRAVAAYDVSCLMEYKNLSLTEAMDIVVNKKLVAIAGEGGMIGVDNKGNFALLFNSAGMYRGVKCSDGSETVDIYR